MSLEGFSRSRLRLDAATMISVLHIIPRRDTRLELLNAVKRNLKASGLFLVDVPFGEPYYKHRMIPRKRIFDGYVMGAGRTRTFHKEFRQKEISKLVQRMGFRFKGNLGIRRHHSLIFTAGS